ncbi:sugar phosphate isomerase/epimerase family protein [Abyssalbus ytuae]|uniref:Sugar phosphate isomerase/epimerase n=1 Tax=Abyssalbus ytuae TaxID=2926907 RepID=A0A9E7D4P8_9FLAO|nr:sugar phosphate isomerase/epimerase family protein [Abyssalbus ytuae]UOB19179.1 sugar phosphate isomerase/epimerase [Abyssalbus ytuae]
MKRQSLFKTLFLSGIALLIFASCGNKQKKKEEPSPVSQESKDSIETTGPFFKLSLAQWSLHKAIREDKTLSNMDFAKKAKELGFQGIEYVSQLYPLEEGNEQASLDSIVTELKKRSEEYGLKNVLIMIDHEGDLAVNDKAERDKAIEKHKKWVNAAATLGCSSVRVNLFGGEAEKDPQIWHANAVDGLGRLTQYAATKNINVIVENHGGLSSDAEKLTAVIKEINLPNCGTLPDFGNFCVQREGGERWGTPCVKEYDKYKGVAEMLPYAKGVSAKSYDFDSLGNETTINYSKMIKIIKDAGYTGFIGVEYEGNKLREEEGIIATKKLLLKEAKDLN